MALFLLIGDSFYLGCTWILLSLKSLYLYMCVFVALTAAAGRGKMDVCRYLLEQRAQVQQVNRRGMCALLCAVRQGHWQVRHSYMQKGLLS